MGNLYASVYLWLDVRAATDFIMGEREDTVAVVTVIDVAAWRLVRLTLSSAAPDSGHAGVAYQVWHLARPGLKSL